MKDSPLTTVRFGCGEDDDDVFPEIVKYTHTHNMRALYLPRLYYKNRQWNSERFTIAISGAFHFSNDLKTASAFHDDRPTDIITGKLYSVY